MVRQPSSWNKTCLKKGTWSTEEDQKLIAYIMRYGIWNWNEMPKFAGLARSGKSCRLRWMNYLRPNIKHGNFTREEEETIVQLQKLLGNRWSAIAAMLPQRTDNDVKNYWNTRLKKRSAVLDNTTNSPSATTISPTATNSSTTVVLPEQENSSDADSSIFLDRILLDMGSTVPTLDEFPETSTFSPSDCLNRAAAPVANDHTYNIEENFVYSEEYWRILCLMDNEDYHTISPNSLQQPIYSCDSYCDPVDDFWVSPLI